MPLEDYTVLEDPSVICRIVGYEMATADRDGEQVEVIHLLYEPIWREGDTWTITFSPSRRKNSKWGMHLSSLQALGLTPLSGQPNSAAGKWVRMVQREMALGRGQGTFTVPIVMEVFGEGEEGKRRAMAAAAGETIEAEAEPAPTQPDPTLEQAVAIYRVANGNPDVFRTVWTSMGLADPEGAFAYAKARVG